MKKKKEKGIDKWGEHGLLLKITCENRKNYEQPNSSHILPTNALTVLLAKESLN